MTAADGQEAVTQFSSNDDVALVICDIVMPIMDGISAGQKMRELCPSLPLLFLSGYAKKVTLVDTLPAGAEILSKPVSIEQLSHKIADLLPR